MQSHFRFFLKRIITSLHFLPNLNYFPRIPSTRKLNHKCLSNHIILQKKNNSMMLRHMCFCDHHNMKLKKKKLLETTQAVEESF